MRKRVVIMGTGSDIGVECVQVAGGWFGAADCESCSP